LRWRDDDTYQLELKSSRELRRGRVAGEAVFVSQALELLSVPNVDDLVGEQVDATNLGDRWGRLRHLLLVLTQLGVSGTLTLFHLRLGAVKSVARTHFSLTHIAALPVRRPVMYDMHRSHLD
jgi:hypothetical protein